MTSTDDVKKGENPKTAVIICNNLRLALILYFFTQGKAILPFSLLPSSLMFYLFFPQYKSGVSSCTSAAAVPRILVGTFEK